MRITIVAWSLGVGGAQLILSLLANEWITQHDVVIVTLDPDVRDHFSLSPGVQGKRLEVPSSPLSRVAS